MGLETYHSKRDFRRTPEPKGKVSRSDHRRRFVVQEHHASMLHFDFRLEMDGVLKSWSVRRGPTLDPSEKRLAVTTEDHPVEYLKFQGHIPEGNYGAGEHIIWDSGTYELTKGTDALRQFEEGRLSFRLQGEKLRGEFHLVRMGRRDNQWLLIKSKDEFAEEGWQLRLILDTGEMDAATTEKPRAKSSGAKPKSSKGGVRKISSSKDGGGAAVSAASAFKSEKLEGDVRVRVGEHVVALTHLDKIYWPEDGYTKGDLIRYYYEVGRYILPYIADRPLIMKRYPNGIGGSFFHQHDVNEAPDYVRTVPLDVEEGHTVDYIVGDNLPTLLYMANLGAIERHPWHSRVANLERPDWVVFDLDPENVEFEEICEMALTARDVLARLGLESHAKTSGSRGIHIYVPLKPVHEYELVAEFAEMVAVLIVGENPELATVERSLKKRQRRRIYIDHMQNARGKSVVAPYSVRPRAGATVSAPLEWGEVKRKKIKPQDFTIKNVQRRLSKKGDLFKPVLKGKQKLDGVMDELRRLVREAKRRS